MKSIEITFTTSGETKVEAIGFKGKGCQQATADYEKALGKIETDRKKPEFFQRAEISQTQKT